MTRNEVCAKCDSASMEMCLLIRHCPLWVDRHNMAPMTMHVTKDIDNKIQEFQKQKG